MSGQLDPAVQEALRVAGFALFQSINHEINRQIARMVAGGFAPEVVALAAINASATLLANALTSQICADRREEVTADIVGEVTAAVRHGMRPHAGPVTIQ
jgi:hypothetical protein